MDNLPIKRGGDPIDEDRKRPKTKQQSSSAIAVFLPEDIVIQILLRLPSKTLLRFTSVCRSWRSLISDPIFVKMHLKSSTENEDSARRFIMQPTNEISLRSCSLPSVIHENSLATHVLDYPFKDQESWCGKLAVIVGSVNGLVCLAVHRLHCIFVWNPSTRQSRRLPVNEIDTNGYTLYGFGYDEASFDYKVVATCTRKVKSDNDIHFKTEVRVCGLKSGSWRKIEDFPKDVPIHNYKSNIFVSGSLHWAVSSSERRLQSPHMANIVSLNLTKETYSEIVRPAVCGEPINFSVLTALNGCLSLLYYVGNHLSADKLDLWVMKEYGKPESWSKLFSLLPFHPNLFVSVYYVSRSEILLVGLQMVLYNIENNTHKCLTNEGSSIVVPYIESLVSPYPDISE